MTPRLGDNAPIAIRLEGGLGDHILGMRLLAPVRARFPTSPLCVFSDAAGHEVPLAAVRLSPLVSSAAPVHQRVDAVVPLHAMGRLEYLTEESLRTLKSYPLFLDGHGESMFVDAACLLDIPVYELLAERPRLSVPPDADAAANRLMPPEEAQPSLSLNLSKYGVQPLKRLYPLIARLVDALPRAARIVSIHTSGYEYSHWPEPARTERRLRAQEEAAYLSELTFAGREVVHVRDAPLETVAALLSRSAYFIGVDNGIKHLAWALDVPRTYFHSGPLDARHILQWMPDVNRMLTENCSDRQLRAHIADLEHAVASTAGPVGITRR